MTSQPPWEERALTLFPKSAEGPGVVRGVRWAPGWAWSGTHLPGREKGGAGTRPGRCALAREADAEVHGGPGEDTRSLTPCLSLPVTNEQDDKYWARRRKNNMAAKRSRDARRLKENQIAIRASFLEKENSALRQEVADLRKELGKCKNILAKYEARHGPL